MHSARIERSNGIPKARALTDLAAAALIVLLGFLVYSNSFKGAFILDDEEAIEKNERIRSLLPIGRLLSTPRPIVELSLAINYALGGLNPWGYHLFNLAVHLAAGVALYGVVQRTLPKATDNAQNGRDGSAEVQSPARDVTSASPSRRLVSLFIALIWMVHPLQTESVTYVIQRAESLTGLFYLLTLYCAILALERREPASRAAYCALSIAFCALGMGTKAVMVTAPLIVLLYDRQFIAGSFSGALRRSKTMYAGLATTWAVLALILWRNPLGTSAGFDVPNLTPWQYVISQPNVIFHYLRLAVWPHPLCLDYGRAPAERLAEILPGAIAIGALMALTVWALWRRRPEGFLGAWFFLILAPTSSVVPLADLCVEHRMYLPLAAVVTACVMLIAYADRLPFARRLLQTEAGRTAYRRAATGLGAIAVVALGSLTFLRNEYYADPVLMWKDAVAKSPRNWRAHYNLGTKLLQRERFEESLPHLRRALALKSDFATAHTNMALALARAGRFEESLPFFEEGLRLDPLDINPRVNYGNTLYILGRRKEALEQYRQALRLAEAAGRSDEARDIARRISAIEKQRADR